MDNLITYKEKPFSLNGIDMPIHCEAREVSDESQLALKHYHSYIEILYGVDCHTLVTLNSENYAFNSGDVLIILPNEVHSIYALTKYNKYYVIKFTPSTLQWTAQPNPMEIKYLAPMLINNAGFQRIFLEKDIRSTKIPETVNTIIDEWYNQEYGFELCIHSKIIDMYLWFIRQWNKNTEFQKTKNSPFSDELTESMNYACRYIQSNYSTVTATELSEKTNYSYSYFLSNFKIFTGQSFPDYVSHIRLINAANLLLSTNKTITEIGFEVGFSTTSYFIMNFKKQYQMSPAAYRKKKYDKIDVNNSLVIFEE